MELKLLRHTTAELSRMADESADELRSYVRKHLVIRDAAVASYVFYEAKLCNTRVDLYHTQFTRRAITKVSRLMGAKPLMRNHGTWATEDLPVGRFLGGKVLEEDEKGVAVCHCLSPFGIPRSRDTEGLIDRLDAGVIREVSLSWYPVTIECSICGSDVRTMSCEHSLGAEYDGKQCIGLMDDVRDVIEASLVWKGGQVGTEIDARMEDGHESMSAMVARVALQKQDRGKRPLTLEHLLAQRASEEEGRRARPLADMFDVTK